MAVYEQGQDPYTGHELERGRCESGGKMGREGRLG